MAAKHQDACALIWQHWRDGTVMDDLPPDLKPHTRAAGYAIQAHLESHSAEPRRGWKIAATSVAGQRHINVDGPLAGRLLAEKLHAPGAEISIATNRMRVAEPEFAFRLGQTVHARGREYGVDEVLAMVSALHLAIELPDSRFSDFTAVGGPALIADNACARELVVGPEVTADWRTLDLSRHEVHCKVGARYERDGIGSNVLGDPREALAWCVNEVSALGIDIAAGEIVTTGTCAVPLEIEPGDLVEADFGVLGSISVQIAP
jgi:2-keto-4-pentenoate hydratase